MTKFMQSAYSVTWTGRRSSPSAAENTSHSDMRAINILHDHAEKKQRKKDGTTLHTGSSKGRTVRGKEVKLARENCVLSLEHKGCYQTEGGSL